MNQNQEVVIRLRMDGGNVPQASQQAAQAIGKIGQAGETSARQTAAAMRQLPAQLTDVATQLAGGQNPLLILLQQGGQVRDSFGSAGAAIRGISAAINPVTLGVGALASVVGTLGVAYFQGAKQGEQLRDVTALTGNAAALTESRLASLAQTVSESTQQTVGGARAIAIELARSGTVSGAALESTTRAVARLADVTGEDAAGIAKDFAGMSNGVAKWAAEHNKAWNFITAEQYKYIKRLEEQGKAEEAMIFVNQRLIEQLADQQKNLGLLESAWDGITKAASGAWDAMLGIGRENSTRQQLDIALDRLNSLPLTGRAREAAEQRVQFLKEQLKLENQMADARSRNAAGNRAEIATITNTRTGAQDRSKPYIPGEFQVLDARDGMIARAAFEKQESEIDGFFTRQLAAQDERDRVARDRRLTAEADFLQGLVDANAKANADLVTDDQRRGELQIEIERTVMLRRVSMMGLTGEALEESLRLVEERAALARQALAQEMRKQSDAQARELGEQTYDDMRSALAAAFRDSNNPAKAFANALGNAIFTRVSSRLADALATAAVGRDGQGGFWGDILGAVAGVVGGGYSVDTGGRGINAPDVNGTRGGMSTGTNYVPRDMFALLHRGEQVVPARYNPHAGGRAGGRGEMHVHYHVPAGETPASYAAALERHTARLKAEIAGDLARPGRAMNNAMLAGT